MIILWRGICSTIFSRSRGMENLNALNQKISGLRDIAAIKHTRM